MTDGLDLGPEREVRVIAIIRGCPPQHLVKMGEAAVSAGISALEVTFDSQDPESGIAQLRAALPGVVVGAGTVLSEEQVTAAHNAGAEFVVSPVTDPDVLEAVGQRGLFSIPGAATPTEIHWAATLGADAVKVFPANALGGPDFLQSILTPLGGVALVPTGGVSAANAADYIRAGAAALGVGSWLFPAEALRAGDTSIPAARAEEVMKAVRGAI